MTKLICIPMQIGHKQLGDQKPHLGPKKKWKEKGLHCESVRVQCRKIEITLEISSRKGFNSRNSSQNYRNFRRLEAQASSQKGTT